MSDEAEQTNEVEEVFVIDAETKRKIDKMFTAMFEGNGHSSIMVRLAELEGKVKVAAWIGAAIAILVVGYLFSILTHQVTFGP